MKIGICVMCGNERKGKNRKALGGKFGCESCYNNKINIKKCSRCGNLRPVSRRDEQDRPICDECRKKENEKKCFYCRKFKPVHAHVKKDSKKPVCAACYRDHHVEKCRDCGKKRPVAVRNADASATCVICYNAARPKEICSGCRDEAVMHSRKNGRPLCNKCTMRRRRKEAKKPKYCILCCQHKPQKLFSEDADVCDECFNIAVPVSEIPKKIKLKK